MVLDWFKNIGSGSKKRAQATSDRNAVIRRVVAAASDEGKKREEVTAETAATATATATAEAPSGRTPTPAPRTPAADGPPIPREKVAARAFDIWVRKGRPFGTADQDWLEAEAELRAELLYRPAESLPNKPR